MPFAFTSTTIHERAQIHAAKHGIVDSALKHFKTCAQRLPAVMTLFAEESRLLERIYYKNKNQQRSSLFWRKIEESRRFVSRVLQLNLIELVEALRYSFHSTGNSKTLRTSWTQVPDSVPLFSLLKHLIGIGHLLKQIDKRFPSILSIFSRQFNTLSFAPLVLSAISMLSRFNYFISKLQDAFRILWTGLTRLIEGLYSQQVGSKTAKWLKSKPFHTCTGDNTPDIKTEVSATMAVDEDIGSRITAHEITTSVSEVSFTPLASLPKPSLLEPPSGAGFSAQGEESTVPALLESSLGKSAIKSADTTVLAKKRKKKKRDEIDDIFQQ